MGCFQVYGVQKQTRTVIAERALTSCGGSEALDA